MTAVAIGDRSATMVDEAHHRFYNSLQLVVSATNGILRGGGCAPHARERLMALQERVALLAEVNRHLSGPFGPGSLAPGALRRLSAGLAASFGRTDALIEVEATGEVASPDRCRTLVLLIGELVTNALKHGVRDRPLLIGIELLASADRCRLIVRNNIASRSEPVGHPRIATELASTAGGTLGVFVDVDTFTVTATIGGF